MKNNLFSKVPVKVPNRAGHNMSHENLFTAKCGTLTPSHIEEVFPNEIHELSVSAQIQLPPFATDVYGRLDGIFETFFVPNRLLYGGWQEFITYQTENSLYPELTAINNKPKYLPIFKSTNVQLQKQRFGPGTLSDYLGNKIEIPADFPVDSSITITNILPYLAYHKIWDDWYRQSQIQRSCFSRDTLSQQYVGILPFVSYGGNSPHMIGNDYLSDGSSFFKLRQRSWAKDYFTNSTPLPQAGEPFSISMPLDSNNSTSFNMNQLYALNALQQFSIRHNLAGNRYADNIFAFFGCYPSDAIVDRSLYLGRKIIPVYTKSIYQTNNAQVQTNNPFSSVATKFGAPMGVGTGKLVNSFKTTEHGFLFTIFSLVPRPYYSTGQRRYLRRNSQADYPNPVLHGIGDQPIYVSELVDSLLDSDSNINYDESFGYTQYASEVKFHPNEVHGLLRDGQSLDSFAIQRGFNTIPELGTAFLEIPTNFLDQVTAINGEVSQYGCWVDAHFNYKKLSPFQPYSIPTLMDLENSHTIMIDKGGKRL